MTATIYMAGPIQHSHSTGKGWRNRVKQSYPHIRWADPLEKYDNTDEAAEWEDEKIVAEDKQMIANSDGILIHYETVPSWGTPREQEYVAHLNEMARFCEALMERDVDDETIWGALNEINHPWPTDTPVFVQTVVDDVSPWLTVDAECVEAQFSDCIGAIESYFRIQS